MTIKMVPSPRIVAMVDRLRARSGDDADLARLLDDLAPYLTLQGGADHEPPETTEGAAAIETDRAG